MTTETETGTEAAPDIERREMKYSCLNCNSHIFLVLPGEATIKCAQCAQMSALVLYSCNDCCPTGYRFCPICRAGIETDNGCFID